MKTIKKIDPDFSSKALSWFPMFVSCFIASACSGDPTGYESQTAENRYVEILKETEPVSLFAAPERSSAVLAKAVNANSVYYIFEEKNGYLLTGYAEQMGWIDKKQTALAEIAYVPQTMIPQNLACYGVEPFWSLEIDLRSDRASYDMQGLACGTIAASISMKIETKPLDRKVLMVFSKDRNISAVIEAATSSDSMSDRFYPYQVDLKLNLPCTTGPLKGVCLYNGP